MLRSMFLHPWLVIFWIAFIIVGLRVLVWTYKRSKT
jgi:hypothetical protein